MPRPMVRSSPVVFAVALLLPGCAAPPRPAPDPAVAAVVVAARELLAALPPSLRERAQRPFAAGERTQWAFVPGRYPGVEFGELDGACTERVHALLRTLLSARGHRQTFAIVQLENVLRELAAARGADASHRDPGRYALLVCGEPRDDAAFAVRLQGHHVSLHFTFLDGWLVGATPHFLGSNPHRAREHDPESRVLAAEEDVARELLASLDAGQRARAVLAPTAPPDVLLSPRGTFAALGAPRGLPASAMSAPQRELLWRLVKVFALRLRHELAAQELERLRPQLDTMCFAWLGGTAPGVGHYWRVHGQTFAIEYDNTQDGANHVHTVWRDRERDFGGDPLREHLQRDHARGR